MVKKELLLRNPLGVLGRIDGNAFGAVLAPAGAGKTAILIQLALSAMLQSRNVVHISLDQTIDKVRLWYEKLFEDISREYSSHQISQTLQETLSQRFIMTFKVEGFSVPKLEERLTDLIAQDIFHPQMLIIDGYEFGPSARDFLPDLKRLAAGLGVCVWFTMRTHRHEAPDQNGLPPGFSPFGDLFDVILQLETRGTDTLIRPLKGIAADSIAERMRLNPVTMLISTTEK
jgi:hypothetical protein